MQIVDRLVQACQALLRGEERVDIIHHVQIGPIQRIAARQNLSCSKLSYHFRKKKISDKLCLNYPTRNDQEKNYFPSEFADILDFDSKFCKNYF